MMHKAWIIPLATAPILLLSCTANRITGNGSQTGNPTIAAMLYNPGGSPAANARVRFYPVTYNPSTGTAKALATTDSTVTDAHGNYTAKLDTGTYNVLAKGDSGVVYQDSIRVFRDSVIHPPSDTLKPAGGLRGRVRLQPGDDARTVLILFMGTNILGTPDDSIGNFTVANMAQGTYRVRFLTTLDAYLPKDTVLSFDAGRTDTLPHDIVLQYTGIPVPSGLTINYDTLKQIVDLSWHKPITGRTVKGYNIYRRNVDSNTTLATINLHPVTDTAYSDSTGVQDQMYEYRVAAVDTNGTEGVKSTGISTVLSTYFHVDSSFGSYGTGPGQFENLTGIAVDKNGNVYVADGATNRIQVFNSNMTYQLEIDSPKVNFPTLIDVDSSGNIYSLVSSPGLPYKVQDILKIFSSSGVLTDSIGIGLGTREEIRGICVHNNELFIVVRNDSAFTSNRLLKKV